MAKQSFTKEQIHRIDEAWNDYYREAFNEPREYAKLDTDFYQDEKVRPMIRKYGEVYGFRYCLLIALLSRRKRHVYRCAEDDGWLDLTEDMSACGVRFEVSEVKETIQVFIDCGLLEKESFEAFGNVQSERLNRDSDAYARKVADTKIKAFKTNLARQHGE